MLKTSRNSEDPRQLTAVLALLKIGLGADFRMWNFGEPVFNIRRGVKIRGAGEAVSLNSEKGFYKGLYRGVS